MALGRPRNSAVCFCEALDEYLETREQLNRASGDELNVVMPDDKVRNIRRHVYLLCFSDSVRFGDVVMQPPSLTAKPRKAAETNKVCSYTFGNSYLETSIIRHYENC